jgi:hypothetical protein
VGLDGSKAYLVFHPQRFVDSGLNLDSSSQAGVESNNDVAMELDMKLPFL